MNQPAKVQEPSMEEILASIRRIIADDDAAKTQPGASDPPAALQSPGMGSPAGSPHPAAVPPGPMPPPAAARSPVNSGSRPMNEIEVDPILHDPGSGPDMDAIADGRVEADILELTEAMAALPPAPAFRTIDGRPDIVFEDSPPERAVAAENPPRQSRNHGDRPLMSAGTSAAVDSAFNTLAHTILVQNARTLEDLVKEMLQPLLKAWLDDNLPGLVERLVRAEIERVSRGRS
jgi:cell pole-organizing protein PopZ